MDRPYEDPEHAVNEIRAPGSRRLPMFRVPPTPFCACAPVLRRRKRARLSSPAWAHT